MRTIIKHSYIRTGGDAVGRARAHLRYIQFRPGKDPDEREYRKFFNAGADDVNYHEIYNHIDRQSWAPALIHKFILSPGIDGVDIKPFTRQVMNELSHNHGRDLIWWAVEHNNTDNHHAHIVVMGLDARQRQVRFKHQSYDIARQTGDNYLEDTGAMARWRAERDDKNKTAQRIIKLARSAAIELMHRFSCDQSERRQQLRAQLVHQQHDQHLDDEQSALGDPPPDQDEIRARQIDRYERDELRRRRLWQEYARPIKIKYSAEAIDEKVIYTWRSSLKALRELERDYLDGDRFVRDSMTPADYDRLVRWIKDAWREQKITEAGAARVTAIELDYAESPTVRFDARSDYQELKELKQLHARGVIHLMDDELAALSGWIKESFKRENAGREMSAAESKTGFDLRKENDLIKLFLQARNQGQPWASIDLSDEDYRMLISKIELNRKVERIKKYRDG